jgi:asparagine N-glycosylation enzyme membrane subunit Stt3
MPARRWSESEPWDRLGPVQLLIFTVLGMVAFLVGYAFGLGGAVSALVFLAVLMTGTAIRVAQPLLERLKP